MEALMQMLYSVRMVEEDGMQNDLVKTLGLVYRAG